MNTATRIFASVALAALVTSPSRAHAAPALRAMRRDTRNHRDGFVPCLREVLSSADALAASGRMSEAIRSLKTLAAEQHKSGSMRQHAAPALRLAVRRRRCIPGRARARPARRRCRRLRRSTARLRALFDAALGCQEAQAQRPRARTGPADRHTPQVSDDRRSAFARTSPRGFAANELNHPDGGHGDNQCTDASICSGELTPLPARRRDQSGRYSGQERSGFCFSSRGSLPTGATFKRAWATRHSAWGRSARRSLPRRSPRLRASILRSRRRSPKWFRSSCRDACSSRPSSASPTSPPRWSFVARRYVSWSSLRTGAHVRAVRAAGGSSGRDCAPRNSECPGCSRCVRALFRSARSQPCDRNASRSASQGRDGARRSPDNGPPASSFSTAS